MKTEEEIKEILEFTERVLIGDPENNGAKASRKLLLFVLDRDESGKDK